MRMVTVTVTEDGREDKMRMWVKGRARRRRRLRVRITLNRIFGLSSGAEQTVSTMIDFTSVVWPSNGRYIYDFKTKMALKSRNSLGFSPILGPVRA